MLIKQLKEQQAALGKTKRNITPMFHKSTQRIRSMNIFKNKKELALPKEIIKNTAIFQQQKISLQSQSDGHENPEEKSKEIKKHQVSWQQGRL